MKSLVCVVAVSAFLPAASILAQDLDDLDEEQPTSEESPSEEDGEDAAIDIGGQIHHSKAEPKFFYTLPMVKRVEGLVWTLRPGAREWEKAEESRYYPLGTAYRTEGRDTRMTVAFGRECSVVVVGEAAFGTRNQGLGEKSRAIFLKGGVVSVKLPRNLPEGMFVVDAPGFSVVNPAGNSIYRYAKTSDGDMATVRCVTGTLSVRGLHFNILSMRAANEVKIQTSQDALFTGIYGSRGDYVCKLDQGLVKVRDVETGESHVNPKFLEWKVSPQTAVRIQRAVPEIGANMAVSVMTFDAAGNLKNRCAFVENRFEINSGELAPSGKDNQADLARRAAEATSETGAVETEAVEAEAEAAESPGASDDSDDLDF
ncbi:MAG: hypothetical protein IJ829_02775 [Kiritimatiellae bacterium]|nr:hypothetical protein [Kiritimatiellia bacterium]